MQPASEYWLRGPVPGIPALLQPAAHALLQARDEVRECLADLPEALIWHRPAGMASVAFHLQHLAGVMDRLLTYAKGGQLDAVQLAHLEREGTQDPSLTLSSLLERFSQQVDKALDQLKATNPAVLTEGRGVGRKQIPSTVIGLLFHAAEHTMRHTGQLLVTVAILKEGRV
ncbi:MAG: DinB family protein [Chitinophagaceae bacterium]